MTNISNFDEENEVNDCSKFTQLIEKTLLAFQIEVKFIFKLIESDKQMAMKLLGCIYEPVLRFLNTESEVSSTKLSKYFRKKSIFFQLFKKKLNSNFKTGSSITIFTLEKFN